MLLYKKRNTSRAGLFSQHSFLLMSIVVPVVIRVLQCFQRPLSNNKLFAIQILSFLSVFFLLYSLFYVFTKRAWSFENIFFIGLWSFFVSYIGREFLPIVCDKKILISILHQDGFVVSSVQEQLIKDKKIYILHAKNTTTFGSFSICLNTTTLKELKDNPYLVYKLMDREVAISIDEILVSVTEFIGQNSPKALFQTIKYESEKWLDSEFAQLLSYKDSIEVVVSYNDDEWTSPKFIGYFYQGL